MVVNREPKSRAVRVPSVARMLRTWRNQPLQPWRFLAPLHLSLRSTAELLHAIARELDSDARWSEAASALDAAADLIRDVTR